MIPKVSKLTELCFFFASQAFGHSIVGYYISNRLIYLSSITLIIRGPQKKNKLMRLGLHMSWGLHLNLINSLAVSILIYIHCPIKLNHSVIPLGLNFLQFCLQWTSPAFSQDYLPPNLSILFPSIYLLPCLNIWIACRVHYSETVMIDSFHNNHILRS